MSTKKYPTPFYAAAGAGEIAYQQLRKLADRVSTADFDHLRDVARRNAVALLDDARGVYAGLVARGEKVVGVQTEVPAVEAAPAPVKRTRATASK